jgi:hypothetical protein
VARLEENKEREGDFTIRQKKKKQEIIEEDKHQVTVPQVGEEEKKALEQTGDDTTSGW